MVGGLGYGGARRMTVAQVEVMGSKLGYDDGGRYALLAISGYSITGDTDDFGTVFSIVDCDTGDEVEQSPVVKTQDLRTERRHWIGRCMHLNGKEDVFAA